MKNILHYLKERLGEENYQKLIATGYGLDIKFSDEFAKQFSVSPSVEVSKKSLSDDELDNSDIYRVGEIMGCENQLKTLRYGKEYLKDLLTPNSNITRIIKSYQYLQSKGYGYQLPVYYPVPLQEVSDEEIKHKMMDGLIHYFTQTERQPADVAKYCDDFIKWMRDKLKGGNTK